MSISYVELLAKVNDLKAALETFVASDPSAKPAVPVSQPTSYPTDGPWAGAFKFKFAHTYNGLLQQEDLDAFTKKWHDWVLANKPETKEIHVNTGRPTVWALNGGLNVQSMSPADVYFSELRKEQGKIAAERAAAERQAAGWTGKDFLTSPTGATRGLSGYAFGPYTRPKDV